MAVYGGPDIVTDGLILYWDIANSKSYTNQSSIVYDLSGNNRNGTVNNVVFNSNFGGVIETSGIPTSNITLANTSLSLISSNYTVIGASRYNGASRQRIITAYNNWLLGHWSNRVNSYYAGGFVSTQNSINDTNWRIYAGTGHIVNDLYNYYINGILVASNSNGVYGPDGIKIGGYISSENSTGQFSFLQIYNRVLSASEVLQNYNALKGRFGL